MSTICGIFNTDDRPVSVEMGSAMMDKMSIYPMDVSKTWFGEQIFLGCSMQYITPESKSEVLPFFHPSTDLAITADAIIDNRNDLFNLLNIPLADRHEISDSQLILMAYEKWGEESPKYLVGDFAFAIWNKRKKELFCARDHVGKQTLYFFYSNTLFAFCTLIKPISAVIENSMHLNEEWIADFLSLGGVLHEIDCNQTIYKDINQLPPAHTITLNSDGMKKTQYWHPLNTPELHLKSDDEYEEAFRDVFFEAVRCRLRSSGHVGVMLSGGLDSGSVASVAAIELGKRGKRLKAFSAIPISEYKDWLPKRYIADESQYVNVYNQYYNNIDITYCRSEGKNSITNVQKFLSILEQPYKIIENLFWVDELEKTAAKNGCKVILDGQFGNLTISYGDFLTHILTLFRRHKWISIFKEIDGYSKLHNLNSLFVTKIVADRILKCNVLNSFYKKSNTKSYDEMVPVNQNLAIKWNVKERFNKPEIGLNSSRIRDLSEARKFITNNVFFSHLGPLDTKFSLANGLVRRDPTRDKRIIEFCMSLPGEQYVRNGRERYLIRRAMNGILPDPIRTNTTVRGKQSADWIQRLSPVWTETKHKIEEMLGNKSMETYFNIPKLKQALMKLGDSIDNETWGEEVRMLLISLIFYYFIASVKNEDK